MQKTWFVVGGVLVLAALLGALALGWVQQRTAELTSGGVAAPAGGVGQAKIGGPFVLTADDGTQVTEQVLLGKYHLLFFGFADCPDMCPGMLQLVAGIKKNLPEATQKAVQMVFVSVDPERDTLDKLGGYVRSFDSSFVGWTGTPEQIAAMSKAYLVYHAKKPVEGGAAGDYTIDHSGFLYLLGPDGRYIKHFPHTISAVELQDELVALIDPTKVTK